ncbi:hypothetical protein I9W82_002308 [Candida metapsilosis]|uniref:Uncharacterized protein n=1 Tax=Candida metapsilosis TaxID=273372 RepID=A0A8H8DCL2_9ASCO|nr:hypothetical protein I9W82_002308 [Candida metapsilosis]
MAGLLDLLNADEILNREQQQRERQAVLEKTQARFDSGYVQKHRSSLNQDHRSPRSITTPPPTYLWRRKSVTNNHTSDLPIFSIKSEGQPVSTNTSLNSSPIEVGKVTESTSEKHEVETVASTVSSSVSPPQFPSSPSKAKFANAAPSSHKPVLQLRDRMPKSRINRRILGSKSFVKFAIRRKYSTKKKISDTRQSKLHIKSLKAGIKIKLTKCDNLINLYHCLIPFTDERKIYCLFDDALSTSEYNQIVDDYDAVNDQKQQNININKYLVSESLQLIDNNVVDLNEYSNKIIKSFTSESGQTTPTFNSLDTAVNTLFGSKDFTLVRITRSTTDDVHGSSILKLETAKPGDFSLIDDEENSDEMLHSLGGQGEVPNNLFFKKIIARPRYKSNMKIYFIPSSQVNYSLYTDCRSFERDLYNGVIQVEFEDIEEGNKGEDLYTVDVKNVQVKRVAGYERNVYCTFPIEDVLLRFKKSLVESLKSGDISSEKHEGSKETKDSSIQTTTPPTQTIPAPQFDSPLDLHPIHSQVTPQHQPVFNNLQSPPYPIPASYQQHHQLPEPYFVRSLSLDSQFGGIRQPPPPPPLPPQQHLYSPFVNGMQPQKRSSYPPPFPTTSHRLSIHHQPLHSNGEHANGYVQLPPLNSLHTPRSSVIKEDFAYPVVQRNQTQSQYNSSILPPINSIPKNIQPQDFTMPRSQEFQSRS